MVFEKSGNQSLASLASAGSFLVAVWSTFFATKTEGKTGLARACGESARCFVVWPCLLSILSEETQRARSVENQNSGYNVYVYNIPTFSGP